MKRRLSSIDKDIYRNQSISIPFDFDRFVQDNQIQSTISLTGNRLNVNDLFYEKEEIDELTE